MGGPDYLLYLQGRHPGNINLIEVRNGKGARAGPKGVIPGRGNLNSDLFEVGAPFLTVLKIGGKLRSLSREGFPFPELL